MGTYSVYQDGEEKGLPIGMKAFTITTRYFKALIKATGFGL